MQKATGIETLYIDFDAFFANVEKQLNPALRDRPVGITALDSEYSALITRCYLAKRAGIRRGMRVNEAQEKCPEILIQQARPDIYVDIHNQILAEVNQHVPITKVWSIDEVECQLIGSERKRARELAENIRRGLAENFGPYITPSIGLAPNQFLAKIAAEMEKPNGLVVLRPDNLPERLFTLGLTDLPGISKGIEKRLHAAGVTTVEGLWNLPAKHARKIWNNVEGERLWAQLHGYRTERPPTKKRMFGHSRVLSGDFKDPKRAIDCVHLLTVKAAFRLRRAGFLAGALTISIRPTDQPRWYGERRFSPVSDDFTFVRNMRELYYEGLHTLGRPRRLKAASVMLHSLSHAEDHAYDMFQTSEHASKQDSFDTLMTVIDGLNMKHGRAVCHVGTRAKLPGGYAGAKIAFGRVPDKEDFF